MAKRTEKINKELKSYEAIRAMQIIKKYGMKVDQVRDYCVYMEDVIESMSSDGSCQQHKGYGPVVKNLFEICNTCPFDCGANDTCLKHKLAHEIQFEIDQGQFVCIGKEKCFQKELKIRMLDISKILAKVFLYDVNKKS